MSALLNSADFNAIKSTTTLFPEWHLNGLNIENPESKGIFISPSEVISRLSIKNYVLTAVNEDGKCQWDTLVGKICLGDLCDVDVTGVVDNNVIVYDQATKTWHPGTASGFLLPGLAIEIIANTVNVLVDNSTLRINLLNEIEIKDGGVTNIKLANDSISFINTSGGILYNPNTVVLGGTIDLNLDNTVIRTNVANQTINGNLTITGDLKTDSKLILKETGVGNNTISLQAPVSVTADYSLTLPPSQGSSGDILENDGFGNLSWVSSSFLPAGIDGSVQFNDGGGVFGGENTFLFDKVTNQLTVNGIVEANEFFAVSDAKLKKDVCVLNNSLETINKINGYQYKWKYQKNKNKQYGVIAQELEENGLGQMVNEKDGFKSVNYNQLVPLLIEAVKELTTKVKYLEGNYNQ